MSATSHDRLSRYARLATANPVATNTALVGAALAGLGSSALADTYDGSGSTPAVGQVLLPTNWGYSSQFVFSAGGIGFSIYVGAGGPESFFAGFMMRGSDRLWRGGYGYNFKAKAGGSQSITISQNMTSPDVNGNRSSGHVIAASNWNTYYNPNTTRGTRGPLASSPTGFLGFSAVNDATDDVINGFVEYSWSVSDASVTFTVNQWAYNINSAITMPANGGGGAVPGLGGLAALACGAAGVRRNRQRVA